MQNAYATADQIATTPSNRDNVGEDVEFELRVYGCELIQEAGILLKLPQVVMATGQALFQRFYFMKSMKEFDVMNVAMGALFLSCKVEECLKRIRDVVSVFHHLLRKRQGLQPEVLNTSKQEYWDWKNDLIKHERYILRELGFNVYVEHPHKFILNYMKILDGSSELAQRAWSTANDSLRCGACVQYRPEAIAVASIFLASRQLGIPLPESGWSPWWELFDTTAEEIHDICEMICHVYKLGKARKIDLKTLKRDPRSSSHHSKGILDNAMASASETMPSSTPATAESLPITSAVTTSPTSLLGREQALREHLLQNYTSSSSASAKLCGGDSGERSSEEDQSRKRVSRDASGSGFSKLQRIDEAGNIELEGDAGTTDHASVGATHVHRKSRSNDEERRHTYSRRRSDDRRRRPHERDRDRDRGRDRDRERERDRNGGDRIRSRDGDIDRDLEEKEGREHRHRRSRSDR